MTRIDHAAESQRLVGATDTRDWNEPSPYVDRRIAAAQVHATLALAKQQRIANLVAIAHATDGALSIAARDLAYLTLGDDGLNPDVAAALGIGGDQ